MTEVWTLDQLRAHRAQVRRAAGGQRAYPEAALQRRCVGWWRDMERLGKTRARLVHVPNQRGNRTKLENIRLKEMGVCADFPDLQFIPARNLPPSPRLYLLECKAPGKEPDAGQRALMKALEAENDCLCDWFDTLDRFVACVESFGLISNVRGL